MLSWNKQASKTDKNILKLSDRDGLKLFFHAWRSQNVFFMLGGPKMNSQIQYWKIFSHVSIFFPYRRSNDLSTSSPGLGVKGALNHFFCINSSFFHGFRRIFWRILRIFCEKYGCRIFYGFRNFEIFFLRKIWI